MSFERKYFLSKIAFDGKIALKYRLVHIKNNAAFSPFPQSRIFPFAV